MPATEKQAMHDKDNYALPLKRIDHIELYVGNALHTAHYFCTAFGFTKTAYAGLETGVRDRLSIVLEQNNVRLVLTSPLTPEGDIAQHIGKHGDGIKDIAFLTDDAVEVFDEAVKRGAVAMGKPAVFRDRNGEAVKATISGCGDTVHSFITRDKYEGSFFPDYHPAINKRSYKSCGLEAIDHVAFGLEPGTLSRWVEFYEQVFGFYQSHQEDVFTEYSGMNTKVVQNGSGSVRFPMMEPVPGKRKSQIEEYLIYHRGPGVQHIAITSEDIISTIRALRHNCVEFLPIPDAYYDTVKDRIKYIDMEIDNIRELKILADRDSWGYLLQIFTKHLQSRPTVFMEVIQRMGARGFGGGNIKALFEAIEREQAIRGNL